ncbi:Endonuclease/exonuclease/phosphatase [Pilobolus umbonatus]|nr:Endonuclease/exonuclease/phosphatase [Pilobolus umbonatus]
MSNKSGKIPSNIEELKRIKMAKKEANKKLNILNQQKVSEPAPSPLIRPFHAVPDQPKVPGAKTIRVMSFNILAQCLIKRKLFPDSGEMLKWKTRRRMILEEIQLYAANIIAFQEMDNYNTFYNESLNKLGYKVVYHGHPAKLHGCAVAVKSDTFDIIACETVDYNTDPLCSPSIMTGNVAQLVALKYKNSKQGFIIGNTHLYWKPSSNYERFRQTLIYTRRLLEFKQKMVTIEKDIQWDALLLGDYNTTPDDPVYGILVDGSLSKSQIQDLNESRSFTVAHQEEEEEEEEDDKDNKEADAKPLISLNKLDTVDVMMSKFKDHVVWDSIYRNIGKMTKDEDKVGMFGEPKFSNYTKAFKGLLDYMFIMKGSKLRIKTLLMPPDEEDMKPTLPNRNFGSDHICLVTDIEVPPS